MFFDHSCHLFYSNIFAIQTLVLNFHYCVKSVNNLFTMEVPIIKFMFLCVLFVIIVEMYLFFAFERIRKYVDTRVETGIEVRI